jgi:hypothetical protein
LPRTFSGKRMCHPSPFIMTVTQRHAYNAKTLGNRGVQGLVAAGGMTRRTPLFMNTLEESRESEIHPVSSIKRAIRVRKDGDDLYKSD